MLSCRILFFVWSHDLSFIGLCSGSWHPPDAPGCSPHGAPPHGRHGHDHLPRTTPAQHLHEPQDCLHCRPQGVCGCVWVCVGVWVCGWVWVWVWVCVCVRVCVCVCVTPLIIALDRKDIWLSSLRKCSILACSLSAYAVSHDIIMRWLWSTLGNWGKWIDSSLFQGHSLTSWKHVALLFNILPYMLLWLCNCVMQLCSTRKVSVQ